MYVLQENKTSYHLHRVTAARRCAPSWHPTPGPVYCGVGNLVVLPIFGVFLVSACSSGSQNGTEVQYFWGTQTKNFNKRLGLGYLYLGKNNLQIVFETLDLIRASRCRSLSIVNAGKGCSTIVSSISLIADTLHGADCGRLRSVTARRLFIFLLFWLSAPWFSGLTKKTNL